MRGFRKDERGSVSVMFAGALLVLLVAGGLAIDISMKNRQSSRLQDAMDAAVVAASAALAEGKDWAAAERTGLAMFSSASGSDDATISLQRAGQFEVKGTARAKWSRGLSRLMSHGDLVISVDSHADQSRRPIDIVFMVDVSGSMGIGATEADIDNLNTLYGCAFVCHYSTDPNVVRGNGIKMRIDVARDALVKSIDEIETNKPNGARVRVAIVTFSNSLVSKLDFTEDFGAARSFASSMDLTNADSQGGTNFHLALDLVKAMIQTDSASLSPKPVPYVMMLTDGVEDTRQMIAGVDSYDAAVPTNDPFIDFSAVTKTSAFAEDLCDSIKSEGVNMMVLHTKYVTKNVVYGDLIEATLVPVMAPRMEKCVSQPEFLRHADQPDEIVAAAVAITKEAIGQGPRIVN